MSEKELAKYRFALIQVATFKQPSYIEDGKFLRVLLSRNHSLRLYFFPIDDTIYDHKFAPEDCLGLDHVDKSGKSRGTTGEKAIVIKG